MPPLSSRRPSVRASDVGPTRRRRSPSASVSPGPARRPRPTRRDARPWRRLALLVAVSVAPSLIAGQPAMAQDTRGENDNVVVVRNHQPGAFRWRARSAIAHDPGPSATNQNVAYAYASCTDCRTVAVAVQVVVLEGPVTDFRPANAAVAVNDSCLRCQTYAYGHQVVLSAGRMVELSADAEQRVDQLDHQMDQVAASSEGFDQMTSGAGRHPGRRQRRRGRGCFRGPAGSTRSLTALAPRFRPGGEGYIAARGASRRGSKRPSVKGGLAWVSGRAFS